MYTFGTGPTTPAHGSKGKADSLLHLDEWLERLPIATCLSKLHG